MTWPDATGSRSGYTAVSGWLSAHKEKKIISDGLKCISAHEKLIFFESCNSWCLCIIINLFRHVSILYACVEKLKVAGEEVPSRQVMCTVTEKRKPQSVLDTSTELHAHFVNCKRWKWTGSPERKISYLWNAVILFRVDKTWYASSSSASSPWKRDMSSRYLLIW